MAPIRCFGLSFALPVVALLASVANATTEIDDDFSTDTSADYNGVAVTVATGVLNIGTDDGIAVHSTAISGTGDFWMRGQVDLVLNNLNSGFVIGASSAGSGIVLIMSSAPGSTITVDQIAEYTNGGTFQGSTDIDENLGAYTIDEPIGLTIDLANDTIRLWVNPTGEPTSVTDWEGGGDAADATVDYGTPGYAEQGRHIGFGTWDTVPDEDFDNLTGGLIGGGSSAVPIILQQH